MSQERERGLSKQESDVLLLVALGYRNSLVADYLQLSVQAVESHRIDLCKKLGIVDAENLDAVIAAALFPSASPDRRVVLSPRKQPGISPHGPPLSAD